MSGSMRSLRLVWLGARVSAHISQRLAAIFAWRLWFTPWRVELSERARAREAAWLAGTTPLRIPFGGGQLAGFCAGDGPTVLLVHGWSDRASRLGAFVEPLVASGFRAVAVDLPAHGDSPGRMTNAYEAAEALQSVSEHLGGVYGVVAHSMGGAETLLAIREGFAPERVVLLASAVRLRHAVDQFSAMFGLPRATMTALSAAIERRFGSQVWDDLSADRIAAHLGDIPALLFHDGDDTQVTRKDAELLASAWPGARLVTTSGLGHDRLLRDPDVVQQAVAFLYEGSRAPEDSAVEQDDLKVTATPRAVARNTAP
jgi:pimeloyl-ACP methyl ester carboxylesterase